MTTPATTIEHISDTATTSGRLAMLALLCGVVCIAFSGIFVKLAQVPGASSAFYRFFFASVPLALILIFLREPLPGRQDFFHTSVGGLFFALDLLLWNSALLLIPAADATLLANNAPIWVGLYAWLARGHLLGWTYWCGLLLAVAGAVVLNGLGHSHGSVHSLGMVLSVAASLAYACYLLITSHLRTRMGTLNFMSYATFAGAGVLLIYCLATNAPLSGFGARTWWSLLGLGLVTHFCGWLLINYALGHVRVAAASVTLLGQTLLTALFAWPILGEHLTLLQMAGGSLVLLGILLVNRP
jgi:drug/metabolite transporter (DMT)-like permease